MRAIRWHGRKDVRFEDVEDAPLPGPGEVRIQVDWCGICGTDLEEWAHGPLLIPVDKPNVLSGIKAPLTMGHEVAGTVVDVGSSVSFLKEGDSVCLDAVMTCGHCWWCDRHEITLCPDLAAIGLQAHGGLAERVTVPASMCVRTPEHVPPQTAALAEPLAVGVRAVRKAKMEVGSSVTVLGAGTVGLATLVAARAMGAGTVAVADPLPDRRNLASRMGADLVFDPLDPSDDDDLVKATSGRGPDIVIDCAGTPGSGPLSVSLVRAGGRAVIVGLCGRPSEFVFADVAAGEKEIVGSLSHVWDEDFRAAVRLLEYGLFQAEDVVGAYLPLEEAVTKGFELLGSESEKAKVLVSPHL